MILSTDYLPHGKITVSHIPTDIWDQLAMREQALWHILLKQTISMIYAFRKQYNGLLMKNIVWTHANNRNKNYIFAKYTSVLTILPFTNFKLKHSLSQKSIIPVLLYPLKYIFREKLCDAFEIKEKTLLKNILNSI